MYVCLRGEQGEVCYEAVLVFGNSLAEAHTCKEKNYMSRRTVQLTAFWAGRYELSWFEDTSLVQEG